MTGKRTILAVVFIVASGVTVIVAKIGGDILYPIGFVVGFIANEIVG